MLLAQIYENATSLDQIKIIKCLKTSLFSSKVLEFDHIKYKNQDDAKFWEPEVFVNGRKSTCLLDSGASRSTVSLRFLNTESIKKLELVIRPTKHQIILADGSIQPCEGIVSTPIQLDNQSYSVPNSLIMNNLSYDIILGREFMSANGIVLDFKNNKLLFIQNNINSIDNMDLNVPIQLYSRLIQPVKLEPFTETKVLVQSNHEIDSTVFSSSYSP